MSINTEIDDQATQQMMAMLGEEETNASDVDDLLDALDDLDNLDTHETNETTAALEDPLDTEVTEDNSLDELDAMLADNLDPNDNELDDDVLIPETQTPAEYALNTATETDNTAETDLDIDFGTEIDDELLDTSLEQHQADEQNSDATADELLSSPTPKSDDSDEDDIDLSSMTEEDLTDELVAGLNTEEDDDEEMPETTSELAENNLAEDENISEDEPEMDLNAALETDSVPESEPDLAEEPSIETPKTESAQLETPNNTSAPSNLSQTATAIEEMQTAIDADTEIQNIAQTLHNTTQQATKIALETAIQAQISAQKTQQAINATFEATERALNTAKNAGYELDLTQLSLPVSDDELAEKINQIHASNLNILKENQAIKHRIDALQKS